MNKENLSLLMKFLLSNDLPFNMGDYRTTTDQTPELPYATFKLTKDAIDAGVNQCNTAGCALGWAPFVVPPKAHHFIGEGTLYDPVVLHYESYASDQFGLNRWSIAFSFLFNSLWEEVDNTRQGAAFRIHDCITDQTFFKLFKDTSMGDFVGDFYDNHKEEYEKAKADWLATVEHS